MQKAADKEISPPSAIQNRNSDIEIKRKRKPSDIRYHQLAGGFVHPEELHRRADRQKQKRDEHHHRRSIHLEPEKDYRPSEIHKKLIEEALHRVVEKIVAVAIYKIGREAHHQIKNGPDHREHPCGRRKRRLGIVGFGHISGDRRRKRPDNDRQSRQQPSFQLVFVLYFIGETDIFC